MSSLRLSLSRVVRETRRYIGHPDTRGWAPYSRLVLMSDAPSWVLAYEMQELGSVASRLGITTVDPRLWPFVKQQSVFYASHLSLLVGDQWQQPNRLGMAYMHGKPGTGYEEFDRTFEVLQRHHNRFDRVQATHSEMHRVILQSGIPPEKVFLIPLGVNPSNFPRVDAETRAAARKRFGIPPRARVVGSFQKDGVGWGDGLEAKRVKGPDVLLSVIDQLRGDVPDLFVLLSGPARGYVKAGLQRMGVPFAHDFIEDPRAIAPLYHAIDVYVVSSRQEGGPKAVLEAMSSGVALVTTRVGQAMDLVRHGENGWIAEVEDAGALTAYTREVLINGAPRAVLDAGRRTAEANTYEMLLPLWDRFFTGFVDRPTAGR
jgi:glycosyltransferase involved in cell wall biosynthesis